AHRQPDCQCLGGRRHCRKRPAADCCSRPRAAADHRRRRERLKTRGVPGRPSRRVRSSVTDLSQYAPYRPLFCHTLPWIECDCRGTDAMRFKSDKVGGYQIFAVSGVNTVSFGIDATDADTTGLLGFAVERSDPTENQRYFMYGFKVFRSVVPHPQENQTVSTFDQPVQSLVWDDFTAKDDRTYEYFFHPLKGTPKNIDRSAPAIPIRIRTEPLFSDKTHDVFFNRGVASSQAYAREFQNQMPDKIKPP